MQSVTWPSTVELKDNAAKISAWIEASARRAQGDPDFARDQGIVPQRAMSLFRNGREPLRHADWLRGAVTALLPRGWTFRIDEDLIGRGHLVLTEYQGKPVA